MFAYIYKKSAILHQNWNFSSLLTWFVFNINHFEYVVLITKSIQSFVHDPQSNISNILSIFSSNSEASVSELSYLVSVHVCTKLIFNWNFQILIHILLLLRWITNTLLCSLKLCMHVVKNKHFFHIFLKFLKKCSLVTGRSYVWWPSSGLVHCH